MSAALSLLLAGTLLTAALAKLRDPAAFATTVRGAHDIHGMSSGPRAAAAAVPAAEIATAVALLAGGGRLAAVATVALLLLFTAILRVLERNNVPCACFGAVPSEGGVPRNAALLAVAVALTLAPAAALWTLPLTELFGAATAATGALCTYQLTRAL